MSTSTDNATSRNPERETRILEAATRLFLHFGYNKTTVSDIAREASISKGAIYLHFDSKEALFEALIERESTAYTTEWLQRLEADTQIWSFITMFKLALEVLPNYPIMLAAARADEHVLGNFPMKNIELFHEKFARNQQLFAQLQAIGVMRTDLDPQVIAYLMAVIGYGVLAVGDSIPKAETPPFEAITDGIAKLLDGGLLPPDGGNREAGKHLVMQMAEGLRQYLASKQSNQTTTTTTPLEE